MNAVESCEQQSQQDRFEAIYKSSEARSAEYGRAKDLQ